MLAESSCCGRLLRSCGRSGMAVLTVATYRADESSAPSALAGLGGAAEHVSLEGLGTRAVGQLLDEVLGHDSTEEESRSVHRRTGGNALFVTHVGRLLATGSSAGIPPGSKRCWGALARVSSECHSVLGAAAVLGAEFRRGHHRRASSRSELPSASTGRYAAGRGRRTAVARWPEEQPAAHGAVGLLASPTICERTLLREQLHRLLVEPAQLV